MGSWLDDSRLSQRQVPRLGQQQAPTRLVPALQIFGATVLLWATLFVRGWDIQTLGGVTLTERVNRRIYRSFPWRVALPGTIGSPIET